MIICPTCKEEIEDDSHYCDQCGQALLFCNQCGRVGVGRRCTHCGGLMVAPGAQSSSSAGSVSITGNSSFGTIGGQGISQSRNMNRIPELTLVNESLNIRIVAMNGAIIGRRQGPYIQSFANHAYVSGVHAQLKFNSHSGWCVVDKHSSNGTKLNQRSLQPDVEMTLNNGDILTVANISLQVIIK